jgi:hypothetical protein
MMVNDRMYAIEQLGDELVERTVIVNKALKSTQATGVTMDSRTGDFIFTPSVFTTEGSQTAVTMLHPVNGMYFLATMRKTFVDLTGNFARSDITYMANKLLVAELSSNMFRPNQTITRQQFAVMLVRGLGLPAVNSSDKYMDLSPSDKYAGYCYAAEAYGLMSGTTSSLFSPDKAMTRADIAMTLSRALDLAGRYNEGTPSSNRLMLAQFADRSSIPTYAQNAVAHVVDAGIMKGATSKQFQPKTKVTRAQATILLRRTLESIGFLN